MGILIWIFLGIVFAWFVHVLMKRPDRRVLGDQLLGATGALIGGLTASVLFHLPDSIDGFNAPATLSSIVGAVLLVTLVEALRGSHMTTN